MTIILVSDVTSIVDKSTATNVTNYNNVTNITDNTPDTIVDKESVNYIISEYKQGPAGPPTGYREAKEYLPFVGSGIGNTKTTTGINGNVIYEAFGTGDELYVIWMIPIDLDRNVNPRFEGTFFATSDNSGDFDSSWEIHVTAHNKNHTYEYTDIIYANGLPLPSVAFEDIHAYVELDKTLFLINDVYTLHIKLKRVTSTNDPSAKIGVSDIHMDFGTEGKAGASGDLTMYSKRTDYITDNLSYEGEAIPGTFESAPLWRIKKITIVSGDVSETWADGNDIFDNIWNDRLTLTYS